MRSTLTEAQQREVREAGLAVNVLAENRTTDFHLEHAQLAQDFVRLPQSQWQALLTRFQKGIATTIPATRISTRGLGRHEIAAGERTAESINAVWIPSLHSFLLGLLFQEGMPVQADLFRDAADWIFRHQAEIRDLVSPGEIIPKRPAEDPRLLQDDNPLRSVLDFLRQAPDRDTFMRILNEVQFGRYGENVFRITEVKVLEQLLVTALYQEQENAHADLTPTKEIDRRTHEIGDRLQAVLVNDQQVERDIEALRAKIQNIRGRAFWGRS